MQERRSNEAIAIAALATLALVGLDHVTKNWAEGALSSERHGDPPPVCQPDEDGYSPYQRRRGEPQTVIEDVFELEYAENCGAAFGLLRDAPVAVRTLVFGIAATAASIFLFWYFVVGRGGPFFAYSVPLVVSGALGNLIDRIRYGYVVDFIHWHWHDAFDYPTFNVADITITIGVVMLLIDGFRRDPNEEAKAGDEPAEPDAKAKNKKKPEPPPEPEPEPEPEAEADADEDEDEDEDEESSAEPAGAAD